ncbi:MAG: ROK family protein [Chitinophagaceae bacterium]|nr:ROK family protein [Chitinophagaceae bacterium]
MKIVIGIDIGGTKCAIVLGSVSENEKPCILGKRKINTKEYPDPYTMIGKLQKGITAILSDNAISIDKVAAIGISCGGPLDAEKGVILSPPNLSGWDEVPIVQLFHDKYGIPVGIQNDANACALAEWNFGAGVGTKNMVFLTFGTGLGAGLILNGQLYSGTNDNAGEIGHIRLENIGPVGYGKAGSFEGFCSGGGIAQLARLKALEKFQMGEKVSYCGDINSLAHVTAQSVAEAAENGDVVAQEVFNICGTYLGKGLSIIIDVLNPECIVIGSIYVRVGHLLISSLENVIMREALPMARKVCRVVPGELSEEIGDIAALSVAINTLSR